MQLYSLCARSKLHSSDLLEYHFVQNWRNHRFEVSEFGWMYARGGSPPLSTCVKVVKVVQVDDPRTLQNRTLACQRVPFSLTEG